ncbi:DSC4 family protein [Aspergillus saccharolyticus JOP 1030-1]|uniref:DUF1746-domain-containing protein n=1 Tax=Aspergillus saccharolyticus JOP 1030-1 TaxID=1450539 RepID=A0A318ZMM8_9EURO|nr:DUF1746-domain-containing protein [Aspergillus saccharolyticus JOP 1030-1]PYH47935.1 DUF1746-domain-containing protein [Aspergillus saccharolyticus JOP 1030-1]
MNTSDVYRDAEYLADVSGLSSGLVAGTPSSTNGSNDERMRKIQSTAKIALIDRLLRDLDILIYCELSALYYMDCSIILLALRAIVQLIFFTPKAPPFDPTRSQPYVGAIFLSNLFCMLCHTLFAPPGAGEETRGYVHGGLLIDFVGQKAPVPRLRLLFFDVLVLALDLLMLALVVERVKTVEAQQQQQPSQAGTAATATAGGAGSSFGIAGVLMGLASPLGQGQDHDLEERGVLRGTDGSPSTEEPRAREEQAGHVPMRPAEEFDDNRYQIDERTELLADPAESGLTRATTAARDSHPLDVFASGQAVIMDVGLVDLIREQWQYSPATARRTAPYVPSDQTAAFLRERFGIRVGANGRMERIPQES